jgi:hypothetical protein
MKHFCKTSNFPAISFIKQIKGFTVTLSFIALKVLGKFVVEQNRPSKLTNGNEYCLFLSALCSNPALLE